MDSADEPIVVVVGGNMAQREALRARLREVGVQAIDATTTTPAGGHDEALRDALEHLHTIMDHSPALISEFDTQGRYLSINPAVSRLLGRAPHEVVGHTFAELLPKRTVDLFMERIARVVESRAPALVEDAIETHDGVRHFVTTLFPLLDARGELRSIGSVASDITERKQAEAALAHSRDLMRYVIEHMRGDVAVHDRDMRYVFVSQRYLDDYEVPDHDVIGKHHYDVFPDLPQKWRDVHQLALQGVVSSSEEDPYERANGTVDWTRWECRPWYEADGSIGGLIVYTEIITDRVLAREALRQSEETYRALVEGLPDVVMRFDGEGRHLFVSDNVEEVAGIPADAFIDKTHRELGFPEDLCAFWEESIRRVLDTGGPFETEFSFDAVRGKAILNWRLVPEFAADGSVQSVLSISRDITEHRQAEEERERLQAQLNQSQKMESVGRLAGGVAHDYNNMLGVILGHADLALGEADLNQGLRTHLEEIRSAAERSANLTRQLLAFARRQAAMPRVLDLNGTVEGMLRMLQRLIGEDIQLSWTPGQDLPPVRIDPSQIDQIMANLCVNARDAIEGIGCISIETRTAALDQTYCAAHPEVVPGDYVLLAVSDTGCGMDTDTLAHMFEPFFTTKEMGRGTGLGLATVYGIVKQNEGSIAVYSEPGLGTTFNIYLPVYHGKSEPDTQPRSSACLAHGRETIIAVEDERAVLELTVRQLTELGYHVLATSSPVEAIRLVRENEGQIDLLVTDVVMPEINGRDLAQSLRALCPTLRCVFMSGYTADVIAHQGVLDPDVHFLQKPFDLSLLAAVVREALDA